MRATYTNRYGDSIVFEQVSENEVHMSGYNPMWLRCGYENVYDQAYDTYMVDVRKLEEPDFDLLIDDPSQHVTRHCTFSEFKKFVHEHYEDRVNPLYKYRNLITTDYNDINMIDPSGGPYLQRGYDLSLYFGDKKKRTINSIEIQDNKVILKIK